MIFRSTRLIGFILSIFFHISNIMMFGLATFPWFSLLLTTMFFDPSWPRKIPLFRSFLPWGIERASEFKPNKALVSVLGLYALIHLSLPFRHLLYPGMTNWTEEGHMFSWRMMLRAKHGTVNFFVKKKESATMEMVNPLLHITQRQYEDIIGKPDLILQFAHYLGDYYRDQWKTDVSVYASSRVSLNGRKFKEMIKPGTDLASEKRSIFPYKWIRNVETRVDARLVHFEK